MEGLQAQCRDAEKYPLNMPLAGLPKYTIDMLHKKLIDQVGRLFRDEKGILEFLEFGQGAKGFWDFRVFDAADLANHLGLTEGYKRPEPWCRYLFVSAPSSRDRLNTTHSMLMLCFTHFQVMPEFIDFLLIFGKQTRAQRFHFGAFRHRTRLRPEGIQGSSPGPEVLGLGRSGRDFQVCYNLKSMECSSHQDWPWSPRDCVIDHTFDLGTIRCTWIVIKGNTLIEDRIRSALKYQSPANLSSFDTIEKSFASTLATHLIIAGWAVENWDHFIDFLESKFHHISRRAIANEIEIPRSPTFVTDNVDDPFERHTSTNTGKSSKSAWSWFSRARLSTFDSLPSSLNHNRNITFTTELGENRRNEAKQRLPLAHPIKQTRKVEFDTRGQQSLSFSDLQKVHDLHAKANESILLLQLNGNIMSQLVHFYQRILQSPHFPESIARHCKGDFIAFESTMKGYQDDIEIYIMKLKTLAEYIAECKALLHGILNYQSTQTNHLLSSESSSSTLNMERMADEMNQIARKTGTETVSMKVITLVTLFFLPGTFISTLMSTDVFQDHDPGSGTGSPYKVLNPLQFYFTLSVPLTVLTLLVWACLYHLELRRARMKEGNYFASKMA